MRHPIPRAPEALRRVALHEAAHAVVAERLGIRVERASIQLIGAEGGSVAVEGLTDAPDAAELETRIREMLAGRAADIVFSGRPDAGSASDLQEATRMAAALHVATGLGGKLAVRASFRDAARVLDRDADLVRRVEADLARLSASVAVPYG